MRASVAAKVAKLVCDEFNAYALHCTEEEWCPQDEDDFQELVDGVIDILSEAKE